MPEVLDGAPRPLIPSERERGYDVVAEPSRGRPAEGPLDGDGDGAASGGLRGAIADLDPRSIGGPKLPLVVLALSALLAQWDDTALAILLPEMRADFGFSLQFLLTLGSALSVMTIVLGPAAGYLADRVKRVWLVRAGSLLANGASVVTGLAPGIPQLVAGRAMAGFGEALGAPARFPLLADYYPSRSRARAFAFLAFAGGVGGLLGPTIAGNLGEAFGWRAAAVSLGALATLVTLALFALREPVRGYHDRREMGASEETARREQEPVGWTEAWRAAGSIRTLRRFWYASPFLEVGFASVVTFLPLYYAEEFGLGPRERGYVATTRTAVALIAVLVSAPLADRLLNYRPGRVLAVLGVVTAINAAAVLALAVSPSLWLSVLVALPLGFGFVALQPALLTLISLVVPARVRGLGLRTIDPWRLIGVAALPLVGSFADDRGIRAGMLVAVPLLLLGALVLASASAGVDRDIRAAKAASLAEEAARHAMALGRAKLLVCRDVDVTYDGAQVLYNVDLDVEEGEILALVGSNGSGKSSLLRAIAGVQEASNGAIFLEGRDITHSPPHDTAARGVVLVPGGEAIFATLTVEENLRAAAWLHRDHAEHVKAGMEAVLTLFPVLGQRRSQAAGDLSAGEQQMLGFAQALLVHPGLLGAGDGAMASRDRASATRLLMIDELSLGLASSVVEELLGVLRDINRRGTTIVIVEQSLSVATALAGRVVVMEKGEIRFDGPSGELGGPAAPAFLAREAARPALGTRGPAGRGPRLQASSLSVRFGGVDALREVDVEVAPGEIVGITGPNGAGKTTLFDVLSGFIAPESGKVVLDGQDVTRLGADGRARLGLVRSFQNARLFPALTVRETVAVASQRRMSAGNPLLAAVWAPAVRRGERRALRAAEGVIGLLGLEVYRDSFLDELSTGTRRAVDLACAIAAEPRVLLLDEPSSGLGEADAEQLGPMLQRVVQDTGCALLLIEHDIPLVTSIADQVVEMELGRVVASGRGA